MPTASPRPAAGSPAWPMPMCAAEDGLVGEGWGAVIKVLRTSETERAARCRRRMRGGRDRLRLAQHAGADEGLFPARRPDRQGGHRRLVLHRRHRRARRARTPVAARARARRDQQGRHEDLSGRCRRRGRAFRQGQRRLHLCDRGRDVRPDRRHGGGAGRYPRRHGAGPARLDAAPSGRAQDAVALVGGGGDPAHLARQDQSRGGTRCLRCPDTARHGAACWPHQLAP